MKAEMGGVCSMFGELESACWVLVERPGGTRALGRPRHRWENDTKMDWIVVAQDRDRLWAVVGAVMNFFVS
jgi:hypothetical protein